MQAHHEFSSGIAVLLNLLLQSDIELQRKSSDLKALIDSRVPSTESDMADDTLVLMEHRLKIMLSATNATASGGMIEGTIMTDITMDADFLPEGWSKVSASAWKPCPIGVYQ